MHSERLEQLDRLIEPFRMADCQPMQDLARHGVDMRTAQEIARQYYAVNRASPLIMAAGISNIWDEELRMELVSNLYEECGKLDREKSHISLFRRFVVAVDVDPEAVAMAKEGSAAHALITTYLRTCSAGPDHRALAILYAFEDVFRFVCDLVARGIRKSRVLDAHPAEFFELHSVVDILHANRMRTALLGAADSRGKWEECLEIVRLGATLLHDLFVPIAKGARA